MDRVIAEHLNQSYNYFLLLHEFTNCQKSYAYRSYTLKNGKYKYVFTRVGSYTNEYITFDEVNIVSIQTRNNFVSLSVADNQPYLKWVNGLLEVYQNQSLITKFRSNGGLEFIYYYITKFDNYFINICDVMMSSREDLKLYKELFSIDLNYDVLKDYDYFQELKRESGYIIYRDSQDKLNLLKSNMSCTKKKLITEIDFLKKNPFHHKLQL